MTTAQLRELIAEIEALGDKPHTRELSDRVLLAIGWQKSTSLRGAETAPAVFWRSPDGSTAGWSIKCPDPLANLQDATLTVPEGTTDILLKSQLIPAQRHDVVLWSPVEGGHAMYMATASNPARALSLTSLKAALAKREAEDG
ncbi:MAG: hypothetical protein ACR2QC_07865 [Gammaproteobacteria bacterium]